MYIHEVKVNTIIIGVMNGPSLNELDEATFLYIQALSDTSEMMRESVSKIEIIIAHLKNDYSNTRENNNRQLLHLKILIEYNLLISLIGLDLACAFRFYINAKLNYEKIYSAKQIIIILNEGYKKIYNFEKSGNNEVERLQNRNKSFWIKEIGRILAEGNLISLQKDYNIISDKLNEFFIENFDNLKKQRDLSVHYDDKPVEVYDMLTSIDIENIYQKAIPFMDILKSMTNFCKATIELVGQNINK